MKNFKLFSGQEIPDLGEYLKEYYFKYPDIKVFVGTDSAQRGKVTKYATAIGLLRPSKGVHVIYERFAIPKQRDMFTRLWNETEYTLNVANYVHDSLKDLYKHKDNEKIPILHLDFNKSPKFKSYMVHDLSIGYLKGMGYTVYSKPDGWCASFVSDYLLK